MVLLIDLYSFRANVALVSDSFLIVIKTKRDFCTYLTGIISCFIFFTKMKIYFIWAVWERECFPAWPTAISALLNKLLAHPDRMNPDFERFARSERIAHDVHIVKFLSRKGKKQFRRSCSCLGNEKKKLTPVATSSTRPADDIDDQQASTSGC